MKKILYDHSGAWKFYHDKNQGILFTEPKQRQPMVLFDKGKKDFDVCCDENGNITLICQDEKNGIYIFYYNRKSWNKQCILESKNDVSYPKNFRLENVNGWMNCFYVLKHNGKSLLIHHILNNEKEPEVLDSLTCEELPFFVTQDSKNNLYCFYDKSGVGYRRYVWSEKRWEPFRVMHQLDREVVSVSGMIDLEDRIHLVVCAGEEKKYSVCYLNKQGVQEIISDGFQNLEPVILWDGQLHILFDFGGRILQSVSIDGGESFLKAKYFFPGSFARQEKAKIVSARPFAPLEIVVNETYGYETPTGTFEIAIVGEKLKKLMFTTLSKPTEVAPEIESYAGIKEDQKEQLSETQRMQQELDRIIKQLEENNELKMLFQLAKRLDKLESQIISMEERMALTQQGQQEDGPQPSESPND